MPDSATFEAIQTQELDEDSLLKDTLSVKVKGDERLLNAEYMAVKSYTGNDQTFDMYRIVTDTTPDKTMSFTGMSLAPYELNGHIIQDLRPANHTLEYTLRRVLNGTDWRLGHIDSNLKNVTATFYYVSVKEALKELQTLIGCEFVFKVEISGQKIIDKWVEVYREMGNRTKKRFNYGTNALTVVRETNKADIYTALIGRGKGEEVSSAEDNASGQAGYGRKITFEDIEWSTAKGNPLNKPKGQYYIELPQATQMYGIRNIDGTMKARIGVVDFDDEEDKNRLINLTYQQLLVSSRPKVLFKTTVANIGATGIGDTVTIHRHDLNMHYETRVRKVVRNKLNDNKTQIELGDAVVTPSTKQAKQNNATIKNLNQEIEKVKTDVTTSITSADGKNTINYGPVEPTRKRTGDTWYRPHPSLANETQMLVWNGSAWELVVDTSDLTSVGREVKSATEQAEQATQSAKDADTKAKSALDKVGVADNLLGEHQKMIASLNGQLAEDLVTDQTVTNHKTWLTNYGELVANNGYDTTDYIPVNKDDLLSLESTVSHYYKLAFYDTGKNNLGYYDGSKVVLTPSGTAYFGNTGTFNAPADGFVRLSYSTATGGTDTVKLSNQSNLYTLINIGYNNALSALANANRAMQEFGENLISYDGLNRGYWLNAQGKLMENAPYKTTDYIRVDGGERYKLTGGNAVYQVYFYDANRDAIAYYDGKTIKEDVGTGYKYFTATPNFEIDMPSNASYVRIASSIADFSQISFRKLSTVIANMLNEVDSMKKSVENDLSAVRNKANEAFDKAIDNGGKLSTVTQSVDNLKGEISQKVTSADVSTALNTFNETVKTQTASQITESLTGYAKSTDLNGLATEYYARTQATSEAGKVRQELTSYAKSGDLTTLAQNIRIETAESLRSVYTKTETNGLLGDKVSQATYEEGINGVKQSITSVEGKIDNLSVGGRNLLQKTSDEWIFKQGSLWWTALYRRLNLSDIDGKVGDSFTASVYLRPKGDQNVFIRITVYDPTFSLGYKTVTGNKINKGEEGVSTATVEINENVTGIEIGVQHQYSGKSSTTFDYKELKLEKGSIATDWTPAPEDLLGQADFQVFKNTYESNDKSIKSRLTAIDSGKEGSLTYRMNQTEETAEGNSQLISTVKTTADGAVQKTSTEYQTIKERSNLYERVIGKDEAGVKSNISRIVQTSGVIQSEVASAVPNPNLLSGTDFKEGLGDVGVYTRTPTLSEASYFPYGKVATINTPETSGTANLGFTVRIPKKDTWYTLSFYGLTNWVGSKGVSFYCGYMKDSKNYKAPMIEGSPARHKIQITVQVTQDDALLYVRPQGNAFGAYVNIVFYGVKLELGEIATPWENSDPATSSKVTQLADNINLKVSKSDLLSQINVQAGGVLITSGTNKLNITPDTTYIQNSTIKSAMIESLEADKIKTGTLDAGKVKVVNLDANNITANKTNFIQSNWNDISSSVRIDAGGLLSTASDGSQVYLQNGIVGVRNPNGATIGQIGYAYESSSPWYSMQVSYGSHFQIRMSRGAGELNKQAFYIISGGTESYLNTDNIYLNPASSGRVRVQGAMTVDKDLRVDGTILVRSRLEYLNGGYIESQAANSNILINATNKLIIYTNGTNALEFDANNAVFRRKISDNSDIRLKTNIVDMPINSLEAIRNIEIKKFDYLDGRKNYYGIIAQQAQQYLPELINTDSEGYLMVDKSAMTYVNMHAIQQLNSKVNNEISQLKAQIANLQDELALLKGA